MRVLLHGEAGSIPYLSPHLLNTFFPPRNDLWLVGLELGDCCVQPVYNRQNAETDTTDKMERNIEAKDGIEGDGACQLKDVKLQPPKRKKPRFHDTTKPIGYTFALPPSISDKKKSDGLEKNSLISTTERYFQIPSQYNVMTTPIFDSNSTTLPRKSSVKDMHVKTSNGVQRLTPQLHSNLLHALGPNVPAITMFDDDNFSLKKVNSCVSIGDNAAEDTKKKLKRKRLSQCVDRTTTWTKQTINTLAISRNERQSIGNTIRLWIPIVGDECLMARKSCLDQAMNSINAIKTHKNNQSVHVEGLVLIGWHRLSSTMLQKKLIQLVNDNSKVKNLAILQTKNLSQILLAGLLGIDIIGTDLPTALSREGKCWDISHIYDAWMKRKIEILQKATTAQDEKIDVITVTTTEKLDNKVIKSDVGGKCHVLDLNDAVYKHDLNPISKTCKCYVCNNIVDQKGSNNGKCRPFFTRSYLHHLRNVKELLAEVLSFCHNFHTLLVWIEELNHSVNLGLGKEVTQFLQEQDVILCSSDHTPNC